MKITRMFRKTAEYTGKVRAHFDVEMEIDGVPVIIPNFSLVTGDKGWWVGIPQVKGTDGKYYDVLKFPEPTDKYRFTAHILPLAVAEYGERGEAVEEMGSDDSEITF